MQINKLIKYCDKALLQYDIEGDCLLIDDKSYKIVDDPNMTIFDEDMEFIPPEFEDEREESRDEFETNGYVYEFGGRWYTQDHDEEIQLKELRYIGQARQKLHTKSFLGIHSGYELMNGVGLYKDWVNKAKFLGIKALGTCEKNTLAGVIVFQETCKKAGIKSIKGLTIPIHSSKAIADVKLYVKNFQGWLNLLKFNNILNVEKKSSISLSFLEKNREGLFIILDPKTMDWKDRFDWADYYQLDTVEFTNEDRDKEYLKNLEKFMKGDIPPINISDAYYLEEEDRGAREAIWSINKAFDDKTTNQYFKNNDQYASELIKMFEKKSKAWVVLYKKAEVNKEFLVENCNFQYDTDTRHLPKYVLTEKEKELHKDNAGLFLHLIKKGMIDKGVNDIDKYWERLITEVKVLKQGDVVDYFLTLYDIIQFAKREKMLTGIGRGSAGGSLIAYLLGIIQIDPLEFDLLFERFLNSGRMGEYQDRPFYKIEMEDGSEIGLAEGALVRIDRGGRETVVFIQDLKEGDNILKY